MAYKIEISTRAKRDLRQLAKDISARIIVEIQGLTSNPRPPGSQKLTGIDAYRIRIGDYRVVYSINDNKLIVLVVRVGHRRDIYR